MTSMLERVARAMYDAMPKGVLHPHFDDLWPEVQNTYRNVARAAIEAMHEPNSRILQAGYDAPHDILADGRDGGILMENIWRAMISAALKDTGEKNG
jgi:hypothetical protein